jgi:hypothetical protein
MDGGKQMKINPMQLFMNKGNIRQFITPDIRNEDKDMIEQKYDLTSEQIDEILSWVTLYVKIDELPKTIEVEENK